MSRIKIIVFWILIVFTTSLLVYYFIDKGENEKLYNYIPSLSNYSVKHVKTKKILGDPSYLKPYDMIISFESEDSNISKLLGLKSREELDTSELKSKMSNIEYKNYFSLNGVNASRFNSIARGISDLKWWNPGNCNDATVAPYLDDGINKKIVDFGQNKNGKITCCRFGHIYYILIECWG